MGSFVEGGRGSFPVDDNLGFGGTFGGGRGACDPLGGRVLFWGIAFRGILRGGDMSSGIVS